MTCPTDDVLLAQLEGAHGDVTPLSQHLAGCAPCQKRLAGLLSGLNSARIAADTLADATPSSLEALIRFRFRTSGATTLAAHRPRPVAVWLARHRAAVYGAAAVAAAVVVAFLVGGPTPQVSAAQVLDRSEAALLAPAATSGIERLAYAIHYEGPSFGGLPAGTGDYLIEALCDHDRPGRFKLALTGPDGALVRGLVQEGRERRLVMTTPKGAFDLRFHLDGELPSEDLMASRRQQAAKTIFDTLVRAAEPERLGHIERPDAHIIELGPPVAGSPDAIQGLVEVEHARLVLEHDTYRPRAIEVEGRLMGETFKLEVRATANEILPGGAVEDEKWTLPEVSGAVVLEGKGTRHPLADAAELIADAARASRVAPCK